MNTRNQVKTAGSPGKSRLKLLVQKYIPSSQTVTGGAGLPTHSYYNTRKDTYTLKDRGHKGWRQETIDKNSKEVTEGVKLITSGYNGGLDIYRTLTITRYSQLQTLYYTITHFVKERNSTSLQCSDWQSPRIVTSSQKTSDMHDLSMIFDQRHQPQQHPQWFHLQLFRRVSPHVIRGVLPRTTTSAGTQDRVLSVSWSCQR